MAEKENEGMEPVFHETDVTGMDRFNEKVDRDVADVEPSDISGTPVPRPKAE